MPPTMPPLSKPSKHTQFSAVAEKSFDFEFIGQAWQAVDPFVAYVLLPQPKHEPFDEAPATAEYVPARQGMHALTESAPTASEYVPVLHHAHAKSRDDAAFI